MKLGEPLPVRMKMIADLQAQPPERRWPFEFKDRVQDYAVYQVPLTFPKYRLNNGRTLAAQEEWLATHPGLRKDLFSADQELTEAQEQQDLILRGMVDDMKLLQYFRENKQKEPLIMSSNGFIVNGNRRLCAMRLLYEEDSAKYRHFAHIDVIVLPPATEKDIYELEVELQVKPDIHMKYSWLREAMMMRRGRTVYSYDDDDLARIHGVKPKEVRDKIQLLEYADAYLEERNKPKQYHLVEKTEFALRKLRESKDRMTEEGDKILFEKMAYILLDDPEGKGRLYQAIPEVFENYAKIVERVKKEIPVEAVSANAKSAAALLGRGDTSKTALVKAVSNPANREAVLNVMMDVLQAEARKAKDNKAANYSLRRVQEAHTALNEAFGALTDASVTEGIASQLDSVENIIGKIRGRLKRNA